MRFEKVNKYNHSDPLVRGAILEAYNGRCLYTEKSLDSSNLHIDHIIPKRLRDNPDEFKKYLDSVRLPENFELDSLYNFAPVAPLPNIRKGGEPFSVERCMYFLEIAERKVPKIEQLYEQKKSQRNLGKAEQELDIATGEFPVFEKAHIVEENFCRFSVSKVQLTGGFPMYPEFRSNCDIAFKTRGVRDCIITFSGKEVASELFDGLYSGDEFESRGFFVQKYPEQDRYDVQFINNRFALTLNELRELCWVIDEYAKEYIARLKEIETQLEIRGFEKSKCWKDGFRLVKVPRELWARLLDFASHFPLSREGTEWHRFGPSEALLQYFDEVDDSSRFDLCVTLHPEAVDHEWLGSLKSPDLDVWITWIAPKRYGAYEDRVLWGAKKTHDWLINNLIPYSEFFHSTSQKGSGRTPNAIVKHGNEDSSLPSLRQQEHRQEWDSPKWEAEIPL